MRAAAALLGALLLPGCGFFTWQLTRAESGTAEPVLRGLHLEVGATRFPQALERLGAPDTIQVGWDDAGQQFTRLHYFFQRAQGSNVAVRVPRQEIVTYNTGVRFFLIFLSVLRGQSPAPAEVRSLLGASPSTGGSERHYRMSELRRDRSNNGSPQRLSQLRSGDDGVPDVGEGPVTPLDALVLEGAARGVTVLRLEFDRAGLLRRKEFRAGTPSSDLGSQVEGSLLR